MSLYMIQFAYTPEAKAALARVPEDRSVVFGQLVEDMGGRLNAFYNSLGEYDGVAIFELPMSKPPTASSSPPASPATSRRPRS